MMKIAFTGSHGVGKTTLIKKLETELSPRKEIVITKEIPRIICDIVKNPEYFRRNINTLEKQLIILLGQIIQEYEFSKTGKELILCDRTIFDHWAYTLHLFEKDLNNDYISIVNTFLSKHMKSYDIIFYIPIEFAVKDDGTREDDKEFQENIDKIIKNNLIKNEIPHITLTGSVNNRINNVLKVLKL